MKSNKDIAWKAYNLLDNTFEPHQIGYYVTKNGNDEGGEDFCINCIKKQVKEARIAHKKARQEIIEKYKPYQLSGKYSESEIKKSLKLALKDYPVNAKFDYIGHDPDFSGGRNEPATCGECGEYFETDYYPDLEEAERLLEDFTAENEVSPELAWKLRTVLYNFNEKENSEIENILLKIAKMIIKNHQNDY